MICVRSGLKRFSNLLRFQSHPIFGHYDHDSSGKGGHLSALR
jgi:hypothetical protein